MSSSSQLTLLFDPSLIPATVKEPLGTDLELRPLAIDDHSRGHFDVLSVLTAAPSLSPQTYAQTFNEMKACANTYFVIVILDKASDRASLHSGIWLLPDSMLTPRILQIVGSGSIIVERKFLRSAGLVGHIEDIAVSKSAQGRKLGLRIINALEEIGRARGCYKIILDCSEKNIPFYEKCGFKHKEYEMVRYMSDPKDVPKSSTPSRL